MLLPLSSLLLLSLLCPPGLTSPARVIRQRLPKFKNFPIVGLKSTESAEPAELEDHRRDPRETELLEDQFVEEAVFLTPEDREQKALEDAGLDSLFEEEGLKAEDESYTRIERDGGHGHHHAGSQRGGRHQSQPAQEEYEYEDDDYESYDYNDYVEPTPARRQQPRRGKQTGATGVALGVLSNPPSSDGNYNFK